jgi:hypothetical protein
MKEGRNINTLKQGVGKNQRYSNSYESKSNNKTKDVQETADRLYLNSVQREMFRRLMYGVKEYTPEQIKAMTPSTLAKVVTDYEKASRILHIMKAKIYYKAETKMVKAIFPHAKIGERDYDWMMELPKNVTLKKLNISTLEIIEEFIKRKLLPKNFLSITTSENPDL